MGWIFDFLTIPLVSIVYPGRADPSAANQVCSSTGSLLGCALSPLSFILSENRTILKYADGSVIFSPPRDNESSHDQFVKGSDKSYLQLDVFKSKEMITDLRKCTYKRDQVHLETDWRMHSVL